MGGCREELDEFLFGAANPPRLRTEQLLAVSSKDVTSQRRRSPRLPTCAKDKSSFVGETLSQTESVATNDVCLLWRVVARHMALPSGLRAYRPILASRAGVLLSEFE